MSSKKKIVWHCKNTWHIELVVHYMYPSVVWLKHRGISSRMGAGTDKFRWAPVSCTLWGDVLDAQHIDPGRGNNRKPGVFGAGTWKAKVFLCSDVWLSCLAEYPHHSPFSCERVSQLPACWRGAAECKWRWFPLQLSQCSLQVEISCCRVASFVFVFRELPDFFTGCWLVEDRQTGVLSSRLGLCSFRQSRTILAITGGDLRQPRSARPVVTVAFDGNRLGRFGVTRRSYQTIVKCRKGSITATPCSWQQGGVMLNSLKSFSLTAWIPMVWTRWVTLSPPPTNHTLSTTAGLARGLCTHVCLGDCTSWIAITGGLAYMYAQCTWICLINHCHTGIRMSSIPKSIGNRKWDCVWGCSRWYKHHPRISADLKVQIKRTSVSRAALTLCFAMCRFSQVVFTTSSNLTHNLFFYFQ